MSNLTALREPTVEEPADPRRPGANRRRARRRHEPTNEFRTIISPQQRNSRWGKRIYWAVLIGVLVSFTAIFVFPLFWMVTGAMKSPDELAQMPSPVLPSKVDFTAYREAWDLMDLGLLLKNTVIYAAGAWMFTLIFDVSAAYALSKLRPVLGNLILGAMLSTLMIPTMVVLLPAYLTVHDLPIFHWDLLNTPWAIWLPAVANGFNIFLLKRFFDSIPRELLEAAEIDGASPFKILWKVVLPVSRPIIGVVSIFTVVNVWRDFVWPLLVLQDAEKMSISVGIASLSAQMPQNTLIAALVIASVPTIVVFFIFQRHIMAGLTAGSLKG
ncbi:carbohydrate ABC transporter permease [Actinomadura sp. HBU206391]|uniref:carbohydrate ABC transporter permease n=1 Tax=Actinomadura sp. HBU206391 TaxID=2731692 RepID=UPI001650AFD6|nr:carbohydrate ABC transporter permease [Actinomadura sp. HBU206391]MBC6457846.1 carbohydrate ABC transporter permease [Actinomadura sp. HBU206391]